MQEYYFLTYYICLVTSVVIGFIRFRKMDTALRILVMLLLFTSFSELLSYIFYKLEKYEWRTFYYHVSSIARVIIVITYFIALIHPKKTYKFPAYIFPIWLVLAVLNIILFEPLTVLNTNMLMLEGVSVITLSLFSVYKILRDNATISIFSNPHFWIAVLWLILSSSTFFFWAFIKILYSNRWPYINIVLNMQIIICILVYAGFATVLFFYPKMKHLEHR